MKIGMASIDEKGKISGGQAGDQTGREVKICDWYNKPWNVVIRPKDPNKAKAMAKCMVDACANDNIGYDQWNRVSLLNAVEFAGWDFSKIATKTETDCSALVATIIIATGTPKEAMMEGDNLAYTGNLEAKCAATGEFEFLRESKYLNSGNYLKAGDILLNTKSHAAMAIEDGSKANTLKKGCKGQDVEQLQRDLNTTIDAGLEVDGSFGGLTEAAVMEFQRTYGLEVDGKFGPASRKKMEEVLKQPKKSTYKVRVTAKNGLNMRKGPGKQYKVVGVLSNGREVEVLEAKGEWGRVGTDKWICLNYTKKV